MIGAKHLPMDKTRPITAANQAHPMNPAGQANQAQPTNQASPVADAGSAKKVRHIEIKIKKISQLFNSLDPSPFIEKDLDDDAVEFIVSYIREYGFNAESIMLIHLPSHQKGRVPEDDVVKAVHNFFSYKKELSQKNIRMKIDEGKKSLVVGLLFLASCLLIREWFFSNNNSVIGSIIREGLMIGGWVAMWKPISNILYDWWPTHQEMKIYDKISRIKIEFSYGG